jgi:hypothetical protein
MTTKYTVTFKGKQANVPVTVAYGENGLLRSIDFGEQQISEDALKFCCARIPSVEAELSELGFLCLIEQVPQDLSFNVFWEAYAYKVGDRTRAMKEWTALVDADRVKCLRAIPQYKQWLKQKPNIEQLYPQTFLKQRRFDNQFKL